MTDIMLDLETLGTGPNGAIVAIGAVAFNARADDTPRAYRPFYRKVDVQSSIDAGLRVDGSTIKWWMEQSDAARQQTFGGEYQSPLHIVLESFNLFVKAQPGDISVWGNGATFDNVILREAYRALKIAPAWHYRDDKCYRTVANLLPKNRRPEYVRQGVHHNAADDALTQALYLQAVFRELRLAEEIGDQRAAMNEENQ
jgi:exodeoxyribonuclease VIII